MNTLTNLIPVYNEAVENVFHFDRASIVKSENKSKLDSCHEFAIDEACVIEEYTTTLEATDLKEATLQFLALVGLCNDWAYADGTVNKQERAYFRLVHSIMNILSEHCPELSQETISYHIPKSCNPWQTKAELNPKDKITKFAA